MYKATYNMTAHGTIFIYCMNIVCLLYWTAGGPV